MTAREFDNFMRATTDQPTRSLQRMIQMGTMRQAEQAMRTNQRQSSHFGTVKALIVALCLLPAQAFAQYTISPTPFQTALDNSGNIINNACVWTYLAGTTTATYTYQTNTGTANANPIRSDSAGRFTAYLQPGINYKFVYESACVPPAHGSTLRTADNISAVPASDVTSFRNLAEGRLTLTTSTPVTTADVSAATSIFYTPHVGTRVALYDGTASWNVRTFSEVTISITACTASTPYDIWLYDSAGTVTGEILAWASATARATGLTRQDGVYVKSGDATRRYVGTFYCNASGGQTDDTLAKRYLWNYNNRVRRALQRIETTDTWTYTTATYQQANASAANQLDVVVGVAEVSIEVSLLGISSNTNADIIRNVAIGEDSATTPVSGQLMGGRRAVVAVADRIDSIATLRKSPAIGRHFYAWLEISAATGTTTWSGDAGAPTIIQSGMVGSIEG